MKKIDEFVNSLYADVNGKEAKELKQEMRSHLIESVEELKVDGKSEKEAINIALERFGDQKYIAKSLLSMFNTQKKFAKWLLLAALLFLMLGIGNMVISSQKNTFATVNLFPQLVQEFDQKTNGFINEDQKELEKFINNNPTFFDSISYFAVYEIPKDIQNTNGKIETSKLNKVFEHGQVTSEKFTSERGKHWLIKWQFQEKSDLSGFLSPAFLIIFSVLFVIWLIVHFNQRRHLRIIQDTP